MLRCASSLLLLLTLSACGKPAVRVLFYSEDGYHFSHSERQLIERMADKSVAFARPLLPGLPAQVTLRVHPSANGARERGASASAGQPDTVVLVINPAHPDGIERVLRTWFHAIMLHELHHIVRDARVPRASALDLAVAEGMATAFERDITGKHVPWGDYPPEVDSWIDPLRPLVNTPKERARLRHDSDGREWIAHKVGTYLVDRAMRASGRSAAELVTTPTAEILRLADRE